MAVVGHDFCASVGQRCLSEHCIPSPRPGFHHSRLILWKLAVRSPGEKSLTVGPMGFAEPRIHALEGPLHATVRKEGRRPRVYVGGVGAGDGSPDQECSATQEATPHWRLTRTNTRPSPASSSVKALPNTAPWVRRHSVAFIACPGRSEVVSRSPG